MTDLIQECYRVLGLEPGAPVQAVKQVYRQLIKEWHPDKFHGDHAKNKGANEKLKQIIPAYENLIAYHGGSPPKNSFRRTQRPANAQTVRAEPKDPKAQFEEGTRCKQSRNFERAAHWFQQSANQGYTDAMFELGNLFYEGEGVRRDRPEAAYWYRLAGEKGHKEAQFKLGAMRESGDGVSVFHQEALEWYLKAAEQNHAKAQLAAGRLYNSIRDGIKQDACLAAFWFRKAAAQGLAEAEYKLGHLYEWGGRGVKKDFAEAATWFRRAAENGHEYAQFELARFYEEGLGVPQNEREADRWLRHSDWAGRLKEEARAGLATSQASLGHMYETGIGIERDLSKAVKWYRKASIWGASNIQITLAKLYATGSGTRRNVAEAFKWLTIVNRPNDREVKALLESLAREMSDKEIEKAKRLASRFVPVFMQSPKKRRTRRK